MCISWQLLPNHHMNKLIRLQSWKWGHTACYMKQMNTGVWWAVSIVTVLSKHQNIMRSHRWPGRCIIAVKSVSACPAHKHKNTHTHHAVEELIPLWIQSLSQSLLMDQTHNKKRQSHCQNQQMSSHSTERIRHMSEKERETGREQEKERIGGEREQLRRERRGSPSVHLQGLIDQ